MLAIALIHAVAIACAIWWESYFLVVGVISSLLAMLSPMTYDRELTENEPKRVSQEFKM